METPAVPAWLTHEFVENTIRNGYTDYTVKLLSKEVIFDTSIGEHYSSVMYKVKTKVKFDNDLKDVSLFIKVTPDIEELNEIFTASRASEIETIAFAKILPAMRNLGEEVASSQNFDFGAKYFKCDHDDGKIIVLEDLSSLGYKVAERHVGLDLEHCLLVMRTLARYHAASVVLMDKEPEMVASLPEHILLRAEVLAGPFESFAMQSFKNLSIIAKSWSNGDVLAERIYKRGDTFLTDYKKMLELDSDGFNVIVHGDLWVNNMMFRYDTSEKVKDVKFVDYQLPYVNSAAIDLQYFIHTSPTEDVRMNHTEDLLKEYHTELCKYLALLDYENKSITYEKLLKIYERKALNGLYAAVVVFPICAARVEDAMDIRETFGEEGFDRTSYNRLSNPNVVKILKNEIPIFVEKGVL